MNLQFTYTIVSNGARFTPYAILTVVELRTVGLSQLDPTGQKRVLMLLEFSGGGRSNAQNSADEYPDGSLTVDPTN